jgi:ABC-2 type transport system ATP-binding protein
MIEAKGLVKRYGEAQALAGIDLYAARGSVLGILGPNGAGKSTAVRILTTLARADGGTARVAGFDVVTQASEVRRRIGVTAQDATVDVALTGRQNLVMIGELSRIRRARAKRRAAELLDRFDLLDAADRVVKGYSGGMRRRLDLAASLVTRPPVLFLDEPTTGLDPTSRASMWRVIREILDEGVTVLLTTQYLDEADRLAHRIAVIDRGRVIAEGTPLELKAQVAGEGLEVRLAGPEPRAAAALEAIGLAPAIVGDDGRTLRVPVFEPAGAASRVVMALRDVAVGVDEVALHRPSLDDVFFHLTRRSAEQEQHEQEKGAA